MQSNLTGAAGLVSLEDGCINEFVQRGTQTSPDEQSFMEMGGREVRSEKSSRRDGDRGARLLARLSRNHGVLSEVGDERR